MSRAAVRSPSPLPLILAGAAFVLTGYLVWERMRGTGPLPTAPRTVVARGELASFETTAVDVFEENAPSVVHLTTAERWRRRDGGIQTVPHGTGSGFVWSDQGLIVTNYHVIRQFERVPIHVAFADGSTTSALYVAGSREHDIAVLRIDKPATALRPIPLGTSADLRVGQAVFAIGNPFGLSNTLTTGIVSALDRIIESKDGIRLGGLIQVDAAINPGNSGGPLLDSAGRLIGMNTAIYSPSGASAGIGFAVPVDTVNAVVSQLIASGAEPPVTLGVVAAATRLPFEQFDSGAMVMEVVPESAAERAGVRAGDVIVQLDGKRIRVESDLTRVLSQKRRKEPLVLRVVRQEDRDYSFALVELTASL